ncbi:unannotated protein [freshwater metagenome]|uniref:Unannotated protein n=1 Tax=freshwater metagenome TaxID=449393 RepID=A0A6J7FTJ4_9ZZZZ
MNDFAVIDSGALVTVYTPSVYLTSDSRPEVVEPEQCAT